MKVKKGYKYQLVDEDYYFKIPIQPGQTPEGKEFFECGPFIKLWPDGTCLVKIGYAYDGPSGPTIDTDNSMVPALEHDVGAQLQRNGILPVKPFKELFDNAFYDNLIARGMDETRAEIWYQAVKILGMRSVTEKKEIFEYH